MSVVIETTQGDITVDLYLKDRPKTCLNFLKLCKTKAYNMNLFHSVQPDFIAQTGDPTGTGRGGESVFSQLYGSQAKYFEAETLPRIKHTRAGLLSMVNCGDSVLGSQFFFTLGERLDYLDGEHRWKTVLLVTDIATPFTNMFVRSSVSQLKQYSVKKDFISFLYFP